MKRVLSALLIALLILPAFAQNSENSVNDPEADALLEKVSDKYEKYKSAKIDYTLVIDVPETDENIEEPGKIYYKGDMFRWETDSRTVVSDGQSLWIYLKEYNEVQITYLLDDEETTRPQELFSLYETGFIYRIKETKSVQGKNCKVVEMTPIDKEEEYFKIDVSVATANTELMETKFYYANGYRYAYQIDEYLGNLSLEDDFFTFNLDDYPGIEEYDLR